MLTNHSGSAENTKLTGKILNKTHLRTKITHIFCLAHKRETSFKLQPNLELPKLKDRSNRASRYHVSQIFDAANDATTYRDLIKRNEFFFFQRGSLEPNPSECWRCGLSFLDSRVNFGRWTCKEMCTHFPPFVQQCQCSSVSLFRFSTLERGKTFPRAQVSIPN